MIDRLLSLGGSAGIFTLPPSVAKPLSAAAALGRLTRPISSWRAAHEMKSMLACGVAWILQLERATGSVSHTHTLSVG